MMENAFHRWHPWQFVGGVMFQRSFNVWPISAWVSFFFFEKSSRVSLGLTVLRDKFRRLNILRFPIEIENLIVRPQKFSGCRWQSRHHAMLCGLAM
jgi:hypothetical protein